MLTITQYKLEEDELLLGFPYHFISVALRITKIKINIYENLPYLPFSFCKCALSRLARLEIKKAK
jgi:hypothetical protein